LGDVHFGSANCDVALFDEVIAEIREDPYALWIGMGDMVEAVAPNDKRWQAGGVDDRILSMANQDRIGDVFVEKMADKLRPIADKLLSYGDGNHEETFNTHYYTNLSVRILDAIGRPECYTGWAAGTEVVFNASGSRTALPIWHEHGWQAGRKDGAKVNNLDDLMGYIEGFRIYLYGHSHARLMKVKTKLTVDGSWRKLKAFDCYGAHTGSFLRTRQLAELAGDGTLTSASGYAERKGYPTTSLGPIRFLITLRRNGNGVRSLEVRGVQ
jgi:hypothetical protein